MNVNAYCTRCGAKLAPAMGGLLRCPRFTSCGRGGLLEGTGVELLNARYSGADSASA